MGRFYVCPKTGLKKGAWTPDEDELLAAYVKRYGHCNWRELPKYAGLSRCGKSCRLRWLNYLRPSIRRGNYTREEDELIIKLHEKLGNKWSIIAASLPGRTDNEVKNHWHCHLKKHTEHNKKTQQSEAKSKLVVVETANKVNSETPQMIESSGWLQVSPANCSECSPSMIAPEVESPISSEAAFEFDADFWSEPFLMDNFYKPEEPSLVFSPSPLGEALYPYNFYDVFDMDTLLNT